MSGTHPVEDPVIKSARQMLLKLSLLTLVGCGMEAPELEESAQNDSAITVTDGVFEIRNINSGKCVAVEGASTSSGANVVQLTCSGGASQKWQFTRLSGGSYRIQAVHSGRCLNVNGNKSSNGQEIEQLSCADSGSQRWVLSDSSGAFLFKPQTSGANNKKCMDVEKSSTASGAAILQWDCHGGDNQRWALKSVTDGGEGGSNPPPPVAGMNTVQYAIDSTTIFANPERGFYHHQETHASGYELLNQSQLTSYRTDEGVSLILRLFYLDGFRSSSISASYLDNMKTDFARLRAAGLKAVVRFAYSDDSSDAPADRVLAHIAQLKPVLTANADVIATVQVGLIGAWGEWYYTDNFGDEGNISSAQWSARKSLVDALLGALPATRTVQLRTPAFKQRFYGSAVLSSAEAFTPTARARVGHHNDCFLASADDMGTYGSVSADKAYLGAENLYVPQGGETCATSAYSDWAHASADMQNLRYSYLNRDYLGAVYNSWGSSNIDVARRKLGYRLALVDSSVQSSTRAGGEIQMSLNLRNDGYAPPYNPRNVEITARASNGTVLVAKLLADPRRFVPGAGSRIDARLCVPAGTPEGTYSLSLSLPDPEPTLHDRPEYAVRLANTGLWDAQSGGNSLKQSLTVSAASGLVPCAAGSVRLDPK